MKRLSILFCLVLAACVSVPTTEQTRQHVVYVSTQLGHGSGVIINERCVVTAQHVIDGADMAMLTTASSQTVAATITAQDKERDIAVLCADHPLDRPAVTFAKTMPETYSAVSTIGFPMIFKWVYTSGLYQGDALITAMAAPGNSGGGVFDAQGYYIGLVQTIAVRNTPYGIMTFSHLCGIVEMDKIKDFLDKEHVSYAVQS